MLAVRDAESVHGAGGLQTGHGGAVLEGFAGLDVDEVFAAVHNLGEYDAVAQVDVLEFRAEANVDGLGGGDEKGVLSLCKGSTAEGLSKSFGKVEREMRSYQESDSSDHVAYSYQLRDVLPPNKIEALSQGSFCGYVADNYDQKIHPKTFCGEVHAGDTPKHNLSVPQIVNMSRKAIEAEVAKNYEKVGVNISTVSRTLEDWKIDVVNV